MKRAVIAIVVLVVTIYAIAAIYRHMTPKRQEYRFVAVDSDFIATIAPTKKPLSFTIKVVKVNPSVDKWITAEGMNSYAGVAIKTSDGRTVVDPNESGFSWDVKSWSPSHIVWDVSFSGKLKPGEYIVEPVARIFESGKDKVSSETIHKGYVAADFYPAKAKAGNSIKIRITGR